MRHFIPEVPFLWSGGRSFARFMTYTSDLLLCMILSVTNLYVYKPLTNLKFAITGIHLNFK